MNFGFNEEQEMLRKSVRDFLEKECPMEAVRKLVDDPHGYSPDIWKRMAELGWLGLIIPEENGGLGLDFLDLIVVLEEMGYALLAAPYFSTVVLGAWPIIRFGSPEQKESVLPAVAAGEKRLTLAQVEEGGSYAIEATRLKATKKGKGYVLSGVKLFVSDAQAADTFLVTARDGSGVGLFLVEKDAKGLARIDHPTMDMTRRLGEIRLEEVHVDDAGVIGRPGEMGEALERYLDGVRAAISAEMVGGAQKTLDLTAEYAKVRQQFGRPIGSFQAVKHRCADVFVRVESARSLAYSAAWAVCNNDPAARLAAAMAKAHASDTYYAAAAQAIQLHGGIGFTWEHDLHFYFKRAKAGESFLGDATANRERVASLLP